MTALQIPDWLEELAKSEMTTEQTGQIDPFGHLDYEKILKNHTLFFLAELRNLFQECAVRFNQHRKDPRHSIKVYGIAETEADFLVFRNSLKLVVTYSKPGQIEVSFHTLSGGIYAPQKKVVDNVVRGGIPRPPGETGLPSGDLIEIELGPFNEAHWTYHGARVTLPSLVRFYLTEFVKNSG
jgi:hypothetical protein